MDSFVVRLEADVEASTPWEAARIALAGWLGQDAESFTVVAKTKIDSSIGNGYIYSADEEITLQKEEVSGVSIFADDEGPINGSTEHNSS